jgi:hypothetical protein
MNMGVVSLGSIATDMETRSRAGEFAALARSIAMAKGDLLQAERFAEAERMSPRVLSILKSAVNVGTMSGWGSSLSEYASLVSSFLTSLAQYGAFDRLLSDMKRVPLHTRVVMATSSITGAVVGEGQSAPVSSLTVDGATTDVFKAVAVVVASSELLRLGGGVGAQLFSKELRQAVSISTDSQFVSVLTAGLTPITASGSTATAIGIDLATALSQIETSVASRLYIIAPSATAKQWSAKALTEGMAFSQMTPHGGALGGLPVVVSDAVSAGQWLVVDAAQIAAGAGSIDLDASNQADVQMETSPTSPPTTSTVLTGLWQRDLVGLRATRYFTVERLHSSSVAVISGAVYSPP